MPHKPLLSLIDPDRASARIGFLVAAAIPFLAIGLNHAYQSSRKEEAPKVVSNNGRDQRLIDFCSQNVKTNRAFVIFQYGTCVVVDNPTDSENIKNYAITTLQETASPDLRFVCTTMKSNNLVVSFTKPIFHLRFNEDIKRHREEIENDYERFLTSEEKQDVSADWEPPFHAKVGLRSRARLLKDAAQPVVAHIIALRGTKKASLGETASISF